MRRIVGGRVVQNCAASASQMGRFEADWLASNENFAVLAGPSGRWIDRVHGHRPPNDIVFNMDSSVSPTYGEREGTVYSGHFGCIRYHPLFVFDQFGDLRRCALRPGDVRSADGWKDVLEPVVDRYWGTLGANVAVNHRSSIEFQFNINLNKGDRHVGSRARHFLRNAESHLGSIEASGVDAV